MEDCVRREDSDLEAEDRVEAIALLPAQRFDI